MAYAVLEAIRTAGIKIPPCPTVLIDLQQALQGPDCGNHVIERLIGRDMKLAAEVFKTANSSRFASMKKKFNSLDQAIAVLGQRAISNIVRAAALRASLGGPDPRLGSFWERATDIAMLCSIVADHAPAAGAFSPEQAFAAGMFHDCGVAVLMQHYPAYCHGFAGRKQILPDVIVEDATINTSHCLVGQMVAREWNLPDYLHETIGFHHTPLAKVQNAAVIATATLRMSIHIANVHAHADDAEWAEQGSAVIARLGLAEDAVEEFESDVWASFEVLH